MNDKYVLECIVTRYANWLFFEKLLSESQVKEALDHFLNGLLETGIFDYDKKNIKLVRLNIDYENERIIIKFVD